MIRPFISYAREDSEMARRVCLDLATAGCEPWLDVEKLRGGQNWEIAIRDAIRNSSQFIALISKHSVNKRGFVQKEVAHALEILGEFPPDQIFVIPVRLDASSPKHERLRLLHWVDLFPDYNRGFQGILDSLGVAPSEHTAPEDRKDRKDRKADGETLSDVQAIVRARAEKNHPDDFSTRKYVIETELAAWRTLQEFTASDVPRETLSAIINTARSHYPDDFGTRLYVIQNEVEAWRKLQTLAAPEVPAEVLRTIKAKAERDYSSDFGTRLYVIENEIAAWKDLYL